MMKRFRDDGSYMGGLVLCEELVKAQDECISQREMNIEEPVLYYYHSGTSEHILHG